MVIVKGAWGASFPAGSEAGEQRVLPKIKKETQQCAQMSLSHHTNAEKTLRIYYTTEVTYILSIKMHIGHTVADDNDKANEK